jgi:bifunctional non-homologous end joining protein LigD
MEKGKLVFDLEGEKLRGRFGLIHTGARKEGRDRNQWLLIKEKDDLVRSSTEYVVTEALPDSAASGRTMEEIAAEEEPGIPFEKGT